MDNNDINEYPVDAAALDELSHGMIYAELAITDNKEGTLAQIGKANPWHVQALKLITGSEKRAHLPLKDILYEDLNGLILDTELDEHGITKGGQFLDIQGYIAHNDKCIVVSFRCTTSIFDWMTNINSTTSAWEIEDVEQGFSGYFSGCSDLCFQGSDYKPRVHTGMYNNFLSVVPQIRKYVEPLLTDNEKPRKLYIVGHSLGAGIANLMGIYFLMEHDWNILPQSLVLVTAGSPRSIGKSMKEIVDKKRKEYGDKVRLYRLVNGNDAVVYLPPQWFGFEHMVDPIMIKDDGDIILIDKENDKFEEEDVSEIFVSNRDTLRNIVKLSQNEEIENNSDDDAADATYSRIVEKIPKAFRDHMPDFYLKPLIEARDRKKKMKHDNASKKSEAQQIQDIAAKEGMKTMAKSSIRRKSWIPKMLLKKSRKIEPTNDDETN